MSKKVKFKVKKGKAKVKLKSGDDVLPLSQGDIRGLLVLAMASAVGTGAGQDTGALMAGSEVIGSNALLGAGEGAELEANDEPPGEATSQQTSEG